MKIYKICKISILNPHQSPTCWRLVLKCRLQQKTDRHNVSWEYAVACIHQTIYPHDVIKSRHKTKISYTVLQPGKNNNNNNNLVQ